MMLESPPVLSPPNKVNTVTIKPYTIMGYALRREYLQPTNIEQIVVHVTVIACNNLKSFWPVPIDAYVEVEVNGQRARTEVQYSHTNPVFDMGSSCFIFTLNNDDGTYTGNQYINFNVYDESFVGADTVIGHVRCALAAIKADVDDRTPTSVILPLAHHTDIDTHVIGKGFCNSNNYYLPNGPNAAHAHAAHASPDDEEDLQASCKANKTKRLSTICVLISKVDRTFVGVTSALRREDEEQQQEQ
jgi:hypothetical protein